MTQTLLLGFINLPTNHAQNDNDRRKRGHRAIEDAKAADFLPLIMTVSTFSQHDYLHAIRWEFPVGIEPTLGRPAETS